MPEPAMPALVCTAILETFSAFYSSSFADKAALLFAFMLFYFFVERSTYHFW
jgi:hypothetical protein